MVYFSDHGESLDKSHNPDTFDFCYDTYSILGILYLHNIRSTHPQTAEVSQNTSMNSLLMICYSDTLVGLMHAPSQRYDATRDFSNAQYRFNLHNLTTLLGEQPLAK